jgi:hypothetical protein
MPPVHSPPHGGSDSEPPPANPRSSGTPGCPLMRVVHPREAHAIAPKLCSVDADRRSNDRRSAASALPIPVTRTAPPQSRIIIQVIFHPGAGIFPGRGVFSLRSILPQSLGETLPRPRDAIPGANVFTNTATPSPARTYSQILRRHPPANIFPNTTAPWRTLPGYGDGPVANASRIRRRPRGERFPDTATAPRRALPGYCDAWANASRRSLRPFMITTILVPHRVPKST